MMRHIFFHDGELEGVGALRNIINLEGKFLGPLGSLACTLSCLSSRLGGAFEVNSDIRVHFSEKF